jgi:hypothetical protein
MTPLADPAASAGRMLVAEDLQVDVLIASHLMGYI